MKIPVTNEAIRAEARKAYKASSQQISSKLRTRVPLRIQGRMTLGGEPEPTGGHLRDYEKLPPRPSVFSDGEELEVVWFGHRDALSLTQPTDFSPLRDSTQLHDAVVVTRCAVYHEDDEA